MIWVTTPMLQLSKTQSGFADSDRRIMNYELFFRRKNLCCDR